MLLPMQSNAKSSASSLFEKYKPSVYQIKVIDIASGNKSTIGSGFQVSSDGLIATNYHVVSDFILDPDKFRIELLDHEEKTHELKLINFDIVHDLALIKTDTVAGSYFHLHEQSLAKGDRIFSLGNPHDLGMTIIEGTYNGLVEGSRYQKYLFSGSLNAGMSGGPATDSNGEVIGVNVSKGGEQISFLVPVMHLKKLIDRSDRPLTREEYTHHTFEALRDDQQAYYQMLLDKNWTTKSFMDYTLPDNIDKSLKCWGHTKSKEEFLYIDVHRHCQTEDRIYINNLFFTGGFSYDYKHITSKELNIFQFYELLEQNYEIEAFYNGNKEDTTNFICQSSFTRLDDTKWKTTTCIREYIDYRGLYDAALLAIRVDHPRESLVIHMQTSGISQDNILKMHQRFLDLISWKN